MIRMHVHLKNPHKRIIMNAVRVLENGGLIIYPTDTVYGIGCSLYNKSALERLYRLKKKSKFDPISIIVKNIREASQYARISNNSFKILKHCLPGPFTFILPASREIPKIMLSKRKEVGIRIPNNEVCQAILEHFEYPIVNTSANIFTDELLNDPAEIQKHFDQHVDLMLDADWLPDAQESTVINLTGDEVSILRKGKGNLDMIF